MKDKLKICLTDLEIAIITECLDAGIQDDVTIAQILKKLTTKLEVCDY